MRHSLRPTLWLIFKLTLRLALSGTKAHIRLDPQANPRVAPRATSPDHAGLEADFEVDFEAGSF
jgi:hypothetical protein